MFFLLKRSRTFFLNFLVWIIFIFLFILFKYQNFESIYAFLIFMISILMFQLNFFLSKFKTKDYCQFILFYIFIFNEVKMKISINYAICFFTTSIILFSFIKKKINHLYLNLGFLMFFTNLVFPPSIVLIILILFHSIIENKKIILFSIIQFLYGFLFAFIIFIQLFFLFNLNLDYLLYFCNFFSTKYEVINNFNYIPLFTVLFISTSHILYNFEKLYFLKKKHFFFY